MYSEGDENAVVAIAAAAAVETVGLVVCVATGLEAGVTGFFAVVVSR